jgi:hypothetical protein
MRGAHAALDYFHVPGADQRVGEYAQRNQGMVARLIEGGDFTAYPDALRFVIAVKDAGMLIADASSSKNATVLLGKSGSIRSRRETASPRRRCGPACRCWSTSTPTCRTRFRARQARSRDLPDRRARTGRRATLRDSARRRARGSPGGQGRRDGRDRDRPSRRHQLLAGAGADIVVTTLNHVDTAALAAGRLAHPDGIAPPPLERMRGQPAREFAG